jgi:hypothetical protein
MGSSHSSSKPHPPRSHRHPRCCWAFAVLLLVHLFLLVARPAGAADSTCPLRLTGRILEPRVRPGKRLTVLAKLVNRGSSALIVNGTVALRLPLYTTFEKGVAKATSLRLARARKRPVYDPDAHTVAWTDLTLRPRGGIKFKVKVRLQPCYPGPRLDFTLAAAGMEDSGAHVCSQQDGTVLSVAVVEKRKHLGRAVPGCGPTPAPTLRPTPAPTRSCGPGEFRPPAGGPCQFCAPGTYWNQTSETSACLSCPTGQTSLQGATQCYVPCAANSALNTTDLTCVAVPPNVIEAAAANNITIDFATTEVFVVQEPGRLEDTIGAAAVTNQTVIIVLAPGLYPQLNSYVLTTNVVILADATLQQQGGRRGLQTTLVDPVIYATAGNRHFVLSNATIWTDGIIFQGSPPGSFSGGVELQAGATGLFVNTTFRSCRNTGNGGGLRLVGGSSCTVGTGSVFVDNTGSQGGAIHVGSDCAVRVNNTVSFVDNSAPRTSPTAGGGGAIYLASAASFVLDYDVSFAGNVDDDVTVAGGAVSCANPLYSSALANCTSGCTGSFVLPASCPVCSAGSGSICTSCPQGSFGGSGVALVCQLCPYGFTTVFPPSSMSSSACVPVTQSPTLPPTVVGYVCTHCMTRQTSYHHGIYTRCMASGLFIIPPHTHKSTQGDRIPHAEPYDCAFHHVTDREPDGGGVQGAGGGPLLPRQLHRGAHCTFAAQLCWGRPAYGRQRGHLRHALPGHCRGLRGGPHPGPAGHHRRGRGGHGEQEPGDLRNRPHVRRPA